MSTEDILARIGDLATNQLGASVILVVAAIVTRSAVNHYLSRREDVEADRQRRILSNLRNALGLIVVIGLVLIWAPALRTFALSLTAFAVAIIIATKELILCISGSILKAGSGSMRVGDWIEVNALRGEVVDQTLLSTTIQELGKESYAFEFTGRTIVIPNSVFLAAPVTNERLHKRFVFHSFGMVCEAGLDLEGVCTALVSSIESDMADQMEVARRYVSMMEKRAGIGLREPEVQIKLTTTNEGKARITVTAFVPTGEATRIEQRAMKAGLAEVRKQQAAPGGAAV